MTAHAEALINSRLDALVVSHPVLRPLRALLAPDNALTGAFCDAFTAGAAPPHIRGLMLRVLMADPSMLPAEAAQLTAPVLERMVYWMDHVGVLSGRGYSRDLMPKHVYALFGEPRTTVDALTSRAAIQPWWSVQATGSPQHPALDHLSIDELAPLRTVFQRRTLSAVDAAAMAADHGDRSPPRTRWMFRTGCAGLDLRNALVYLSSALADRNGGRVQNRLPIALTERWGLQRLSIPHSLLFVDVAALGAHGCVDWSRFEGDDWLGLREALAAPSQQLLTEGDEDIRDALERHLARALVSPAEARRRRQLLDTGAKEGTFDTGVCFFVERLLAMRGFEAFAPYYAALDLRRLAALAAPRWGNPATPSWAASLERSAVSAIAFRDLGNTRAYLDALQVDLSDRAAVWSALPSVARFRLGAAEPKSATEPKQTAVTRRASARNRPGLLPGLEALAGLGAAPAYLVTPSYRGALPEDGTVFLHAAHSAGFVCPPGVEVIGVAPLPWGVDPAADAQKLLADAGWSNVQTLE